MATPASDAQNGVIKGAWKVLLPVLVILTLVVGGLYLVRTQVAQRNATQSAAGPVRIAVGETLPDFELHPFGGSATQASQLPNKVTMVNFWATWCEACVVEMPSIVKLRQSFKDKGFDVVAVNLDQNPAAVLPRATSKLGIDFPVYVDEGQKLSDLFGIEAIPLTLILDKNRKILMIENGERDWNGADIRSKLEKWLEG